MTATGFQTFRASDPKRLLPELRNEAEFAALCDRVMPAGYAELPVDRLDVAFESIQRDVQLLADFAERLRALE